MEGMDAPENDQLNAVSELERELLTSRTRSDRDRLAELLHEDFVEITAGGVVRDQRQTIDALRCDDPSKQTIMHDEVAVAVADGLVEVRWRSEGAGQGTMRTSLWLRDPDGWKILRHQGTPIK